MPADALKAGATSVFTPDSIFVNYADTGTVTIKAIGDTQIREYTNAEITYGEVKKGDNEESILPVFIRTSDNKLVTAEVESPPAGSREDTIVRILDEIDITVGVSLSSDFSAITYTTSTERIKFNFCGDSYLAFPEQCETPNTENNVYCVHSITTQCVGTKTAARDLLGRCNDACACSADNFNPAVCVKNTCSCVAAPCQEDWVCTQYPATCPSNGIKTRTCTDRNGCGTTTNKPQESISCIPQTTTPCNELWSCLEWSPSPCPSSGIQTRTCTDANNCNTNINKPQESRACTPTPITYCGDGAVQKPNSQGIVEECDGNLDQTVSDNGFCKEIRKCAACKFETTEDKYNLQAEVCDGKDNDCNSLVDDYNADSCSNQEGLCANQLGVCRGAIKACSGINGFQACIAKNYNSSGKYETQEKSCDFLDNDCDGTVDENCECIPGETRKCGFSDQGACLRGTQTCSTEGRWEEACVNVISPSSYAETACDSIDNDCDGKTDECLLNKCGECGLMPTEVCNYRDDSCNAEPGSPTRAVFNPAGFYEGFSDYCQIGTACKGSYADGIYNNNNGIFDEGIDEFVKEKPQGNFTNWCKSCEVQARRCTQYDEETFKRLHQEYYFSGSLKEATEKQITGASFFACPEDITDKACCLESQCVFSGKCYGKGHREDIDNDGVLEICFSQSPGVWHEFGENICENDCTYFDGSQIHMQCNGTNGCLFYDAKSMQVCDLAQPGWTRDYNSSHYVDCASGSPQPTVTIQASVSCEKGTIVKMTRIVVYNGEPVKLVVAVCG